MLVAVVVDCLEPVKGVANGREPHPGLDSDPGRASEFGLEAVQHSGRRALNAPAVTGFVAGVADSGFQSMPFGVPSSSTARRRMLLAGWS